MSEPRRSRIRFAAAAVLVAVAAGAAGIGAGALRDRLAGTRATAPLATGGYAPTHELRSGNELVFVFVGASFCGAQRRPGFPAAVERIKTALARRAEAEGRPFRAVGVAVDPAQEDGLTFLRSFGRFDEVSAGGGWASGGAAAYVWRDQPGSPSVPQVLVLERDVRVAERAVTVGKERLLRRVVGADRIAAWAERRAPL